MIGQKIQNGKEIPPSLTETERLILVVETLQEEIPKHLTDDVIKRALNKLDILPRSFPAVWGGRHKDPRDPLKPKTPNNSYIYYGIAIRPSVVLANPKLSNTEIISLISKMWNETPEEDRGEYEAKATEDKDRYEKEMKIYETKYPEKARASTKAHDKQTKATAHRMFCAEYRQQLKDDNPELDGREITTMLSELWAEIKEDKEQFTKYQELADEANEGSNADASSTSTSTPKKLSPAEQKKADDPEHYELNPETGRYRLKKDVSVQKKCRASGRGRRDRIIAPEKTKKKEVHKEEVIPKETKKAIKKAKSPEKEEEIEVPKKRTHKKKVEEEIKPSDHEDDDLLVD